MEPGKAFSPKVVYVYEKQLEEAEIIVVNKIDQLTPQRAQLLRSALASRFPKARIVEISAKQSTGLSSWFDLIASGDLGSTPSMQVDYDLYAEGEALLGWLNSTLSISADEPFDGNAWLMDFAADLHRRLDSHAAQIAHLKMTLSPKDEGNDIAVLNLVRNDASVEMSHALQAPVQKAELIVNLRAEADPVILQSAVNASLNRFRAARPAWSFVVDHMEQFRPGKPQPTHRFAEA